VLVRFFASILFYKKFTEASKSENKIASMSEVLPEAED
jgi:hypothetical protein